MLGLVGFTAAQILTLTEINIACSALSFIGSSFVIFCYLYFKSVRTFAFKLVFWLALSDAGFAAVSTSFFSVASVLWTLCIAVTLFLTVVRHWSDVSKLEPWFHVICWGLAVLLATLPFTTGSYGSSGPWCWITAGGAGWFWRLFQFYFVLWLVLFINIILYIMIAVEVRKSVGVFRGSAQSGTFMRLGLYPVVMFFAYGPATINRIQNYIQVDAPMFWLYVLVIVTSSTIGLWNAIIYCTTSTMRKELSGVFRNCLPARWFSDEERTRLVENTPSSDLLKEEVAPLRLPVNYESPKLAKAGTSTQYSSVSSRPYDSVSSEV